MRSNNSSSLFTRIIGYSAFSEQIVSSSANKPVHIRSKCHLNKFIEKRNRVGIISAVSTPIIKTRNSFCSGKSVIRKARSCVELFYEHTFSGYISSLMRNRNSIKNHTRFKVIILPITEAKTIEPAAQINDACGPYNTLKNCGLQY